jgi:EcsC family protein
MDREKVTPILEQENTPKTQPDETTMTQVLQQGAGPISALIDKAPPDFKERLSGKLEKILKKSIEQMMATFNDDEVEQRLASAQAVSSTGRLGLTDDQMSIIDEHVKALREEVRQKTVMGSAVTGAFGFLGQFADLPAFYLFAIRTLGDVAISYGFDPRTEREQLFILEVLRIGHVPGRKKRLVQLDALTQAHLDRERDLVPEVSYALSGRTLSVASKQIAALLATRKMGAMIPLVGALVNAGLNWHLMGNILDTANRAYKSKALLYRNKAEADPKP